LLLTVLTGFTGLVYEVAWQRYLSTLLGSHSEATAAVLGIFLGGLSLGYWLFGAVSRRLVARAEARARAPRPLLFYGLLEVGIGVYAILFPRLFEGIQLLSSAIPHGPAGLGFAVDVGLAAVLIGPPTVLMGGTIPLLTQALARSLADATRFHAFVYAFNTAGAFFGALAAGFFLVPRLGLIRVMLAMGALNLAAGACFVLLDRLPRHPVTRPGDQQGEAAEIEGFATYAAVALLVGFAMMTVQTVVIRVAGLAFGSSQFTFSMVVAIFVLCIALGSFAVSLLPRIGRFYLAVNLWALPALLCAIYLTLDESPYWVAVLRTLFRDTYAAFYGYHLLGFLLLLVVIGPPVLLSGAVLPLLFHQLRREVGHLGVVAGNLYSWNTVGSLLGALLGGYALLFWLDLHHVFRIAVGALFAAAVMLTVRLYSLPRMKALALAPLFVGLFLLGSWDPRLLSLGIFRMREPARDQYAGLDAFLASNPGPVQPTLLFYDDDPISSVAVKETVWPNGERSLSIYVNGKSDGDTRLDYPIVGLAAILPAMMAANPERAFVIGWGTGVTAGELASLESTREVIVAEISPGVIQAAPLFDRDNLGASTNPKIRTIQSDAYRALSRSQGTFDVIVSGPSNPWVTGVEMLYSREFLELARDRLSRGGVHCQWFHQYETDFATMSMVLRTYAAVFDQVAVWAASRTDLLLLGFAEPDRAVDHFRLAERAERPDYQAALRRAGVESFAALLAHEVLPFGVVHAARLRSAIHTLYHPRLSYVAGRAFFVGSDADLPFTGSRQAAAQGTKNSLLRRYTAQLGGRLPEPQRSELVAEACEMRRPFCSTLLADWLRDNPDSPALRGILERVVALERGVETPPGTKEIGEASLRKLSVLFPGSPRDSEPSNPTAASLASTLFVRFYHHAAPFDGEMLLDVWSRCRIEQHSERICREAMLSNRPWEAWMPGDPTVDDLLDRCRGAPTTGRLCVEGMSRARKLLEGESPSGW
jgi:predicted membrane-bound spermidine synthase